MVCVIHLLIWYHDYLLVCKGAKGWQPLISSIDLPDCELRLTAQAQLSNSHSKGSLANGDV